MFGAAAGVVVDPERLLWTPGQRVISIPPLPKIYGNRILTIEEITREMLTILKRDLKFVDARDYAVMVPAVGDTIRVRQPRGFAA